jgi:hypothetical protein
MTQFALTAASDQGVPKAANFPILAAKTSAASQHP